MIGNKTKLAAAALIAALGDASGPLANALAIDGQVREHALPMDQHHERVGNPLRQVQHG